MAVRDRTIGMLLPVISYLLIAIFYLPVFVPYLFGSTPESAAVLCGPWLEPLVRTFAFGALASALVVPIALLCAIALLPIPPPSQRAMFLLLLPTIMGPVAAGYLFRRVADACPILQEWLRDREAIRTWLAMFVLHAWQIIPLCVFLLWVHLKRLPQVIADFTTYSHLTWTERLQHIYWPRSKKLVAVLFVFGMGVALLEHVRFHLFLRTSRGTGTEFAMQWIALQYRVGSQLNFPRSVANVMEWCQRFVAVAVPTIAVAGTAAVALYGCIVRLAAAQSLRLLWTSHRCPDTHRRSDANRPRLFAGMAVLILLVTVCLGPLLLVISRDAAAITGVWAAASSVLLSAAASVVPAVPAVGLAVLFSSALRVALPTETGGLGLSSLFILGALYLLHMVPPIGVFFAGVDWAGIVLSNPMDGPTATRIFWVSAQICLAFPLLATFGYLLGFAVPAAELELHARSRASFLERFRTSFYSRNRLGYGVVALLGFCLVWQEYTINSITSQIIPSLSVDLALKVDGRSSAYGAAVPLLLAVAAPAIILCWGIGHTVTGRRRLVGE